MIRERIRYFSSRASVVSPADPGTRIPADPSVLAPAVIFPYRRGISSSTGYCSSAGCTFFISGSRHGTNSQTGIPVSFFSFSLSPASPRLSSSNGSSSGQIRCVSSITVSRATVRYAESTAESRLFPIQTPYVPASVIHACLSWENTASCF